MTSMLNLYKNLQNFQIHTKILTLSKILYLRKCGNNSYPTPKLELFFSMRGEKIGSLYLAKRMTKYLYLHMHINSSSIKLFKGCTIYVIPNCLN